MAESGGWHNPGEALATLRRLHECGTSRESAKAYLDEEWGSRLAPARRSDILANVFGRIRARAKKVRVAPKLLITEAPPSPRRDAPPPPRRRPATRALKAEVLPHRQVIPHVSILRPPSTRNPSQRGTLPGSRSPSPKRVHFDDAAMAKRRGGIDKTTPKLLVLDESRLQCPLPSDPTPPADDGFEFGRAGGRLLRSNN